MFLKQKYEKLVKDFEERTEALEKWKDKYWELNDCWRESNATIQKLQRTIDEQDYKIVELEHELDIQKEKYYNAFKKYVDTDMELQKVDKIVLQYESRINELEELIYAIRRK